ncbi:ArdC-like ssDNA-binding domain-containing protein, partial [Escherichia coli]
MKTKKHTSCPVNKTPERDLYQLVTDRVIEAIEKGVAPWQRPWRSVRTHSGDPMMPVNALTRSAYRGINVLLLWLAAEEAGYSSNCWLTYRQAQALGGQVRKGEKSTMAVIYKSWHKQDEDENGNRIFDAEGNPVMVDVPVLKANPLFNVEQCDGLSLPEVTTTVTENGANDTLNA